MAKTKALDLFLEGRSLVGSHSFDRIVDSSNDCSIHSSEAFPNSFLDN